MSASLRRSMYRSMIRETAVFRPKIPGFVIAVGSLIAGLLSLAVTLWLGR